MNAIRRNSKTVVYLDGNTVRCLNYDSKNAKTLTLNNKSRWVIIGVYASDVSESYVADDLIAMGVSE